MSVQRHRSAAGIPIRAPAKALSAAALAPDSCRVRPRSASHHHSVPSQERATFTAVESSPASSRYRIRCAVIHPSRGDFFAELSSEARRDSRARRTTRESFATTVSPSDVHWQNLPITASHCEGVPVCRGGRFNRRMRSNWACARSADRRAASESERCCP